MNTLSTTTSLITHSLAWALVYSLWQGLLVYGTLFVLLKALTDVNSRVKYYLSAGALGCMFLWFANTWISQYQKLKGVTVFITQSGAYQGAEKTFTVHTAPVEYIQRPGSHSYLPKLEPFFPVILVIYTLGLAFMLCRFAVNIWQLRTMKTKGLTDAGEDWSGLLQYWTEKFGIVRPVQLFLSKHIDVPMVLGALKPVILLPVATINNLTTDQVEAVLMHELAHIKRHDYLLNIVQTIVETLLFFNPFVWLTSAIIRREREHCCDDMVVACAANPLPYAHALAILEGSRMVNGNKLAIAATGQKNQLFHRIKRIMEMKKSNINHGQLTIIVVAILAITFSIAMFTFTPSFAQKAAKKGSGDTATHTKSMYKYRSVTIDSNGNKNEVIKQSDKPIHGDIDDDGEGITVNVSVNDDDNGKHQGASAYSYSYSYSTDDKNDSGKRSKNIVITTSKPFDKMLDEIEKEMAEAKVELDGVDWNEITAVIRKGLAEVNKQLSDEKINIEVKRGLEKSKEALEKAEKELKKSQVKIKTRVNTGNGAAIAMVSNNGEEIPDTDYELMLEKMEKEGLIDRAKGFVVAKQNGKLVINGQTQSDAVLNKYGEYLKDKSVTIKGKNGGLTIDVHD